MLKLHYFDGLKFETCLIVNGLTGVDIDRNYTNCLHYYDIQEETFNEVVTASIVEGTCEFDSENKTLLYYFDGCKFQLILTESMNLTSGYKLKQTVTVDILESITAEAIQRINVSNDDKEKS